MWEITIVYWFTAVVTNLFLFCPITEWIYLTIVITFHSADGLLLCGWYSKFTKNIKCKVATDTQRVTEENTWIVKWLCVGVCRGEVLCFGDFLFSRNEQRRKRNRCEYEFHSQARISGYRHEVLTIGDFWWMIEGESWMRIFDASMSFYACTPIDFCLKLECWQLLEMNGCAKDDILLSQIILFVGRIE